MITRGGIIESRFVTVRLLKFQEMNSVVIDTNGINWGGWHFENSFMTLVLKTASWILRIPGNGPLEASL